MALVTGFNLVDPVLGVQDFGNRFTTKDYLIDIYPSLLPSYKSPGLWAWGLNNNGQLGNGSITNYSSPIQVGSLTNWKQVSGGYSHTIAVKTDGTLWACGYNRYGQLGNGSITYYSSPIQVGSLTNWKQVSSGYYHTAAIKTDGTLWAWGQNTNGQLGDGTVANKSSPIQVGTLTNWKQVSNGSNHTTAISDGYF